MTKTKHVLMLFATAALPATMLSGMAVAQAQNAPTTPPDQGGAMTPEARWRHDPGTRWHDARRAPRDDDALDAADSDQRPLLVRVARQLHVSRGCSRHGAPCPRRDDRHRRGAVFTQRDRGCVRDVPQCRRCA